MTHFEYVVVLMSIVFGLSITRLLTGIGAVLQARARVRTYWLHYMWVLNIFLYNIVVWWVAYKWVDVTTWTFFLVLFVMLAPIVLYLIAVVLFPDDIDDAKDMREHFESVRPLFFTLLCTLPVIDVFDTMLKGREHFAAQGVPYLLTMLAFLLPSIAGVFIKRPRFHAVNAIVFFVYLLTFIGLRLRILA